MKKIIFVLTFLTAINSTNAQTEILKETGSWVTFTNKVKLSEKWSFGNISQMRRVDFMDKINISVVKPSLNYKLNKNITVGVGYMFLRLFPNGVNHSSIKKNESRFWQHITLNMATKKIKFYNRFIFEARFKDIINTKVTPNVIDGSYYAQRFRYRILSTFNLFKLKNNKYILGKISNEVRIKFKTGLSHPDFDQNNIYAYLGYQLLENSKVWIGFGRNYFRINSEKYTKEAILQLGLSYDFDLTKKK